MYGSILLGTDLADIWTVEDPKWRISTFEGDDEITVKKPAFVVALDGGKDTLVAEDYITKVYAGTGSDFVRLENGASQVYMGLGNDRLELAELVDNAFGGRGFDRLTFDFNAGDVDIEMVGNDVRLIDRFTGQEMIARSFELFRFADGEFTAAEMVENFGPAAQEPFIQVGGGTQTVTVNDADPSVSVLWDRVVQEAVIEEGGGPTVASRAYAMMHTAMFDAWSAFDATAVRVSFDIEGDNINLGTGTDAQKIKAMSYAALTVLRDIFPGQEELYQKVLARLGVPSYDDNSIEARIGIDAAEDLLELRSDDGSNQAAGYADATGYTPVNPNPLEINDITKWTPENVPIDPEDTSPEQSFLTAHWGEVEGFAVPENADFENDFASIRPEAPQPFFTAAFAGSTLDVAAGTITLDAPATIGGDSFAAGDTITIANFDREDLFDNVINRAFIEQAEEVIEFSANLDDEDKIIAEFWEDGGGTAFPPGTWMTFGQFVSARDSNSLDDDAKMFFALGNAVMDAGIATWEAKVFYDYARPVRVIRDLGELGLIGEFDAGLGGFAIEAFGGFDADGLGVGTQTILATQFNTFQRPGADPSPPFAEYTSGHSAFSAAGAEVLKQFTGSDDFGGEVTFAPDTIQFERGVPGTEVTLAWDTFTEAADEAGLSRLYGGIHFDEGDVNGRILGRDLGEAAYDMAQEFINGTATDEDRPFFDDMAQEFINGTATDEDRPFFDI